MEFCQLYAFRVQMQANLIVLNEQAEARTWLKWNICLSSSSYRNMQSYNNMTFFKWEIVLDIWATVLNVIHLVSGFCQRCLWAPSSLEHLKQTYDTPGCVHIIPTFHHWSRQNKESKQRHLYLNALKQQRAFPFLLGNNNYLLVKYDRWNYLLRNSSESQSFIRYCSLTAAEWSRVSRTASTSSWAVLLTNQTMQIMFAKVS